MQHSISIQSWLDSAGRRKGTDTKEQTMTILRLMTEQEEGSKEYLRSLNRVCELNLLLVANVVRAFVRKRHSVNWRDGQVEDLLQQGYFGLRRAAEKFDYTRGYTFATYATPCIRQAVTRYFNTAACAVYIPENVSQQLFYIAKHGKMNTGSRNLTTNENLLSAGRCALHPVALDAPVYGDEESAPLHETLAWKAPQATPVKGEETWASRMLDSKIRLAKLDELSAKLVRAYAQRGHLVTAARRCGLSEHKARPMLKAAIAKLEALA